MSFVTNLAFQMSAVNQRLNANKSIMGSRESILSKMNQGGGSSTGDQLTIAANQPMAKAAGLMEQSSRDLMKKDFKNGLSGFDTFA